MKQINFFDGAQSGTTPTIGDVDTSNLVCYANDAAYEAANTGAPVEGNIYCNTTDNVIRYYNGTTWTTLADDASVQTFQNKTIDGTSATGNNTVSIDADDATYDNSSSGMLATDVQAAIDEVEARVDTAESDVTTAQASADANTADIADVRTTQGTSDGDTDMGTFSGTTLSDNSSVKTLLQELETAVEAVGGALVFVGTWNANTNTPSLSDGVGTQGNFYIVDTAGSTSLDGISDWSVNDWAIFDGTVWRKIDNSELVTSVNGQTGNATIGVNDLDGLAGTNGARRELRRDSGNTAWEIYNPHNNATDNASGSNVTLAGVGAKVVNLDNGSLVSIGGVSAGYANQNFILVNKTGVPVTINNEDAGATAADRILTGTSGPIDLDVDAAIPLVYDSGSSRWRLAAGTGGGEGGLSGIITGNNSTADSTVGDWAAYADAAQSSPQDGTGGSPNVTLTRNTTASEILQGKGSFQITKGAFDRQGEGASVDLAVPRFLRGQSAKIAFSYEATADFDFGDAADPVGSPSDISVYLYDVTNSKLLTPNQTGVFGGGTYQTLVTIPSDCEDVRVILHIASTNALAWEFRFDRVQLDLSFNEFIKNSSDAINYTPAIQGFGTVTNLDTTYRIDGDYLEIQGYCTLGTRTAVEAQIPLPTGYVISDDSPSPIMVIGQASWSGSGGAFYYVLGTPGDSFLNLSFQNTSGHVPKLGTEIFTDGSNITWRARVKVNGLTSGIFHPASIGLNAQAVMRAYKNGGAMGASTDIGSWTTVEKDSLDAFNSTTGVYTVKSPGDYHVQASSALTAVSGTFMRIKKNGTSVQVGGSDNSDSLSSVHTILTDLKYGDTISVEMSSAVTASAQNDGTSFAIHKIQSQAQPYAPRVAYIKEIQASGTDAHSGATFTLGAWQTRFLNTVEGDSSFVSLASNQFTLQPGTYEIEALAPAVGVDRHKIKLRNTSDTTDDIIGSSEFASNATPTSGTSSILKGKISISAAKTFEIQHRGSQTQATFGYGINSGFGVSEVYTTVKITKVL